jgi:hypothetical protein
MQINLSRILKDQTDEPIDFPKLGGEKTLCLKCQAVMAETENWTLRDAIVEALGRKYDGENISATEGFNRYLLASRILKVEGDMAEVVTSEVVMITKVLDKFFHAPSQKYPIILMVDPDYKPEAK